MVEALDWLPKRMRQGDLDSTGADRLLGTTSLTPLEVLIRETAQNSWDARLQRHQPKFGITLREPDFRNRAELARLFQNFRPGKSDMQEPFRRTPFHNIEIWDRNTHGLSGRIDMGSSGGGRIDRFKELLYTIGSTQQTGETGGTFGFGKTAPYAASRMGTVIFWSRVRSAESKSFEHRFIASAFKNGYSYEGQQYAGRHWWGRVEGEEVRPIIGEQAQMLGELFFDRGFEDDETGTSLLVLDAHFGQDASNALAPSPDDFFSLTTQSVRRHLWPKLVAHPGTTEFPMHIQVTANGQTTAFASASDSGALADWATGLNAIRAQRGGDIDAAKTRGVEVHRITRYRELVGHLAIVTRLAADHAPDDDMDPANDSTEQPFRIALMRGKAELVVNTVDWINEAPEQGVEWLAIFKSADELEAAFASTEPPAHDRWEATGSQETTLIIRHVKNKVSQLIRERVFKQTDQPTAQATSGNGNHLASRLGGLLPPDELPSLNTGSDERLKGGSGGSRRQTPKWRVTAQVPRIVRSTPEGQFHRLDFTASGPGEYGLVSLSATVSGDDGTRSDYSESELQPEWFGCIESDGASARVEAESQGHVTFFAPARRALSIRLQAQVAYG